MINLDNLGVLPALQEHPPCVQSYPSGFNPQASHLWVLALQDLQTTKGIPEQWDDALLAFLDVCSDHDVMPFSNRQATNDKLIFQLSACRDRLYDVLSTLNYGLTETYKVLSLRRSATLSPQGFTLEVASLFKNEDPTFHTHLLETGFCPVETSLVRRLDSFSVISFKPLHSVNRWEVTYSVSGTLLPSLGCELATTEKLQQALINLWLDLTKSARPQYVGPRFI